MRGFSNDTTVTLHVTRACNLQCPHCYQQGLGGFDKTVIDLDKAHKALDLLKPKGLVFYGGEPLLHPEVIKEFVAQYPHCRTVVITNGTIWNPKIFDMVDVVSVSLGSFRYERAVLDRPYSKSQFETVLRVLRAYREKLLISHDIYPTHHDDDFYRVAGLSDIPVDTYPVVTADRDFILHSAYVPHLVMRGEPLVFPKLRVLESGVITRDMRGVYNLADADHWTEDMKDRPLPLHERCRACSNLKHCPACLMFPAFVHDYLKAEPDEPHHFCKMAKALKACRE